MSFELWLAFAAAAAVLVAIPGPTVLLVISYAMAHGRRAAIATVAGVALGDFTALTGSLVGLGAVLAASATLFTALKWIGAAYLVYLGVKLWRAPVGAAAASTPDQPDVTGWRMFWHTYTVTALNPKGIVFFVAFLPQFLSAEAPPLPQLLIMGATFLVLATINATIYGMAAGAARRLVTRPAVQRAINRTGGTFLIGAGIATAAWKGAN